MTPDREKHLIQMARTTTSVEETRAFRSQLQENGEALTPDLLLAISGQIDRLAHKEGLR